VTFAEYAMIIIHIQNVCLLLLYKQETEINEI